MFNLKCPLVFRHIKYKIRNMQITKACLIKTRTIHFRVKSRNRNTDLESVFSRFQL